MKIALISPVWFPVPPTGYGGIEWIVWLLADGLVDAGHDVTLFASGDSHTKAKLESVYDIAPSELIGTSIVELHHCLACYERADEFEIVNDHSGLPAAALGGAVATPTLHTVHGPMDAIGGVVYEQIARVSPQVGLISISMNQRAPTPDLPVGRQLPERARPLALSHEAAPRRLPPLRRAHEPGQGLPPGDRHRRQGGPAAEDRRQAA